MNTEQWIAKLDTESKALKAAQDRAATSLSIFTRSITFNTTRNAVTVNYTGGSSTSSDPERVIVTFSTNSGANTIAKLEINTNNDELPICRRIPYSGGARWSVTAGSNDNGTWVSTQYTFTVQSLIDGVLSAGEMTS